MAYLDTTGLTYLWGKITAVFAKKADLPQYVICTQTEYNNMVSHDSDTYYIIIADNNA